MDAVDAALAEQEGPYFLDDFSLVDCVFAPFLERIGEMRSSSDALPTQRGYYKTHLDLHSVLEGEGGDGLGSTLSMIFTRAGFAPLQRGGDGAGTCIGPVSSFCAICHPPGCPHCSLHLAAGYTA